MSEKTDHTALSVSKSSLEGDCPAEVDPLLWEQWREWEKLPADDFLNLYGQGRKGHSIGLGNGLTWINRYTYGTHRARYYLIGADSGVGKTTISDFMFVLQAWEEAKRLSRKLRIFYCSFEISKSAKIARWVSYYVFIKYGIRLPTDYIMGRIEGRMVSEEHHHKILHAYGIVKQLMQCISFVDTMIHPTKIFEDLVSHHYEQVGIVIRDEVSKEDAKRGKKGFIRGFKPNAGEEDSITILYIDHYALAMHESGLDTKGTVDKLSKYAVVLRNLFGTTIVGIQQFSTDMLSASRTLMVKKNEQSIAPSRLDFGDTKAPFRDADVVLAYVRPNRELETFMGYDLSKHNGLGDCMVAGYILKNRYGASNRIFPLFLDGVTGYVYDLPQESTNMIAMQPWIEKNREIEKLCQEYSPQKK